MQADKNCLVYMKIPPSFVTSLLHSLKGYIELVSLVWTCEADTSPLVIKGVLHLLAGLGGGGGAHAVNLNLAVAENGIPLICSNHVYILFSMHPFSAPCKHQKTIRFSEVFRV